MIFDLGISNLIELSVSLKTTITSSVSFATRPIGWLFTTTVLLNKSFGYSPHQLSEISLCR